MKPIPHSVNLELAGLFKHPLMNVQTYIQDPTRPSPWSVARRCPCSRAAHSSSPPNWRPPRSNSPSCINATVPSRSHSPPLLQRDRYVHPGNIVRTITTIPRMSIFPLPIRTCLWMFASPYRSEKPSGDFSSFFYRVITKCYVSSLVQLTHNLKTLR